MSYCIRLAFPLILMLLPFAPPPDSRARLQAATELTVATFNCEWLIKDKIEMKYGEKRLTEEERSQKFNESVAATAKTIKRIGADIIALCEVGPEADVEQLRLAVKDEGLEYPHQAVCISRDPTTKQHVAVLSKLPLSAVVKTLDGREFFDKELDDPEEEDDTGVSKGLKVTFEINGKTIHLYVCHLISERGGHDYDAKRVAQASIVRRNYLDTLNKGEHVIVAGDLNAKRGSPALRRIRGRDDLFGDLIQTGHSDYFAKDQLDRRWTYEFKGTREQIDHVLPSWSLREASKKITANTLEVLETLPDGRKVSDHRPLIVTFQFR